MEFLILLISIATIIAFPVIIAGLIRLYQERTKQPPLFYFAESDPEWQRREFGVEPLGPISKTKSDKVNQWDGPDM